MTHLSERLLKDLEERAREQGAATFTLEETRWEPVEGTTRRERIAGRTLSVVYRPGSPAAFAYTRFLDANTDLIQPWQSARLTRDEALLLIAAHLAERVELAVVAS